MIGGMSEDEASNSAATNRTSRSSLFAWGELAMTAGSKCSGPRRKSPMIAASLPISVPGRIRVINSTFFNNYVTRGSAGSVAGAGGADNGADAGGAIFSYSANLYVQDSTFSRNQSTGSGAAIVAFNDEPSRGQVPLVSRFYLYSTIIANNGANECFIKGPLTYGGGAGNLITHNGVGNAPDGPFLPCPGVVSTSDPLLGSLQSNSPGNTPTMAIGTNSPAFNAAEPGASLEIDQRGVARPQLGGFDIGAFEAQSIRAQ